MWTSLGTRFYLCRCPGLMLPGPRPRAHVRSEWEGGTRALAETTLLNPGIPGWRSLPSLDTNANGGESPFGRIYVIFNVLILVYLHCSFVCLTSHLRPGGLVHSKSGNVANKNTRGWEQLGADLHVLKPGTETGAVTLCKDAKPTP